MLLGEPLPKGLQLDVTAGASIITLGELGELAGPRFSGYESVPGLQTE